MASENEELKIIGLQIDGLRKIKAFKMVFDESGLIQLAGKNHQGKTSVIDAIEILFKGASALPEGAISNDSEKLELIGIVGDYTIHRIFNKQRQQTTFKVKKGEFSLDTKPQAFLDTFINDITFNPMPFLAKKPEEKLKFLMDFAGINFDKINTEIQTLEAERTVIGRNHKAFGDIVIPEKVERVTVSELNNRLIDIDAENERLNAKYQSDMQVEMKKINDYNRVQQVRKSLFDSTTKTLNAVNSQIDEINADLQRGSVEKNAMNQFADTITYTDAEIVMREQKLQYLKELLSVIQKHLLLFTKHEPIINDAPALTKPTLLTKDDVLKQIKQAEAINENAAKYEQALEKQKQKDQKEKEYNQKTAEIETKRLKKKQMLLNAKIPIEGIELKEDDVYYQGISSSNWSGAESWIISAKLCMSQNPKLRAVFYDGGELMDAENRKAVKQWCLENNVQFIITRVVDEVVEQNDENAIFIVDGSVIDTPNVIEAKQDAEQKFQSVKITRSTQKAIKEQSNSENVELPETEMNVNNSEPITSPEDFPSSENQSSGLMGLFDNIEPKTSNGEPLTGKEENPDEIFG